MGKWGNWWAVSAKGKIDRGWGRCVCYVQSVDVVELLRDVLPERVARAPDGVGGGVVWTFGGNERATRQRSQSVGPYLPTTTNHTYTDITYTHVHTPT